MLCKHTIVALAACGLNSIAAGQLLTSWSFGCIDDGAPVTDCVNEWLVDVGTDQSLDIGSLTASRALAADNVNGLVFAASTSLITQALDANGEFVEVSSFPITDASGNRLQSPFRVQSLAFANGDLYCSIGGPVNSDSLLPRGFYRVDPATGVATLLALQGDEFPLFVGLAFDADGGMLYGITGVNLQVIYSIEPLTLAITAVLEVPRTVYGELRGRFDGLAAGDGKLFLTHNGWSTLFTPTPIPVLDLASLTFLDSLTMPLRRGENTFYPGGATFFAPGAGDTPLPCPGDVDGDGETDTSDITLVVSNLGAGAAGATGTPGDADGDGETDTADVTLVVSNLGCID